MFYIKSVGLFISVGKNDIIGFQLSVYSKNQIISLNQTPFKIQQLDKS